MNYVRIKKGSHDIAPGVPKNYPDAKKLVTADCIKPNTTEQTDDC